MFFLIYNLVIYTLLACAKQASHTYTHTHARAHAGRQAGRHAHTHTHTQTVAADYLVNV